MNLDQLQALRAIADEGSFEAAAYELGVSASAVSQRIRALEREVGQVLLRRGEVLAAVTTEPQPVQGCAAEPLGSMRYVPLASPALLARHVAGDVVDLGAMPMMRYNAKDDLQRLALSGAGLDVAPPTHLAPSFDGFHRSVRAGLGWGMLVDAQAVEDVRAGRLVRVPGLDDVLVPLYWQAATLPVTRLVRLTRAVREAAQRTLERG
ncbi:LysR family transcriptional regulator [Micrococcus sp. XM4230B]|uniref:LysR family transcriptional regulator n=1 Tax=Micrococcus sp. XM4230B TaxID=2929775 RepID=UPI001FFB75DA|nr:LysR family transcriptional regulator [Micrococcus sp. XM4230B]MCK1800677.1 LysR family transcriptional regulator [Micrococcus sp. XM4230B]